MGLKRKSEFVNHPIHSSSQRHRRQGSSRSSPIVLADSPSEDEYTLLSPTREPASTQSRQKRRFRSRRDIQERAVALRNDDTDSGEAIQLSRCKFRDSELDSELANLADYNKPPASASRRHHDSTDTDSNSSESECTSRKTPKITRKSSRCKNSKSQLAAELAGLADFNKPPVPHSRRHCNSEEVDSETSGLENAPQKAVKADRQSRNRETSRKVLGVKDSRISKPSSKAERFIRRNLKAEVKQLEPWHAWVQELKRNPQAQDDEDDEDDESPKCHQRNYPPKQKGVQNIPWSALSGELRNLIYREVMQNEERVMPTLTHYPNGLPRRTTRGFGGAVSENFPQSSWCFTQSAFPIRQELTPWLLSTRRVRTRLSTVNEYAETFHPRNGNLRQGWIEPFCCGVRLPAHGVEVLSLIEDQYRSSKFHLQLKPTPGRLVLPEDRDTHGGPEMELFRTLSESYPAYANDSLPKSAIQGVRIAPYIKRHGRSPIQDPNDEDMFDRLRAHEFLVKLDIDGSTLDDKSDAQLFAFVSNIDDFIKQSRLNKTKGLRLQARLGGYIARWYVDCNGLVNTSWDLAGR